MTDGIREHEENHTSYIIFQILGIDFAISSFFPHKKTTETLQVFSHNSSNDIWIYFTMLSQTKDQTAAAAAAAAAKSLQSGPTLCDPIVSSPPVSSVPGILQARILEWVAISSSNDQTTVF